VAFSVRFLPVHPAYRAWAYISNCCLCWTALTILSRNSLLCGARPSLAASLLSLNVFLSTLCANAYNFALFPPSMFRRHTEHGSGKEVKTPRLILKGCACFHTSLSFWNIISGHLACWHWHLSPSRTSSRALSFLLVLTFCYFCFGELNSYIKQWLKFSLGSWHYCSKRPFKVADMIDSMLNSWSYSHEFVSSSTN
jgi:hypothetical protein